MSLAQHPSRHVWDFWYYHEPDGTFHVLYLNAERALVAGGDHHYHAQVGYATTLNFVDVLWLNDAVFKPDPDGWDNTAIWTGDVIRGREGFLMFYTSRDRGQDDGMTQNIGLAVSDDLREWERVPDLRIEPDPRWYETAAVTGDDIIHAWRDPYLFRHESDLYMLVAAKDRSQPNGRQCAVGILRSVDGSLLNWEALPPLYSAGYVSESDVPVLYRDDDGGYNLIYTVWPRYDYAPTTNRAGGLHTVRTESLFSGDWTAPRSLLPGASGLYAARVIPELAGDLVGHDTRQGGWRRIHAHLGWSHVDRDFSNLWID